MEKMEDIKDVNNGARFIGASKSVEIYLRHNFYLLFNFYIFCSLLNYFRRRPDEAWI